MSVVQPSRNIRLTAFETLHPACRMPLHPHVKVIVFFLLILRAVLERKNVRRGTAPRVIDFLLKSRVLRIYDLLGREVATLVNEVKQPGRYTVQWDARSVNGASGVYMYRLQAGNFVAVRKLLVIR